MKCSVVCACCAILASLDLSKLAPAQDCSLVWTSMQAPAPATNYVLSMLAYNDGPGDALMVGSYSGLRRWDGQQWSAIGASSNRISSLAVLEENGQPVLYAGHQGSGGGTSGQLLRRDGDLLTPLGGSYVPWSIVRFTDPNGTAIFVSSFSYVRRFDGSTWTTVATCPSALGPSALAVFDDGGGPALYLGCCFTQVNGIPIHGIAKYDGTTWSEVGGGVGGPGWQGLAPGVTALTVIDDGSGPVLYAGGPFRQVAGFSTSIAKWNGQNWTPLGGPIPLDGFIDRLRWLDLGDGPALFVSGHFESIGNDQVRDLARWDSQHWRPVGAGIPWASPWDHEIYAMERFVVDRRPQLVVGGYFSSSPNLNLNNLARFGCICPDLDGDGSIGLGDLTALLAAFGQPDAPQDLDGDHDVDLSDLTVLLANFGQSCP